MENKLHMTRKDERGAIFCCDDCEALKYFDKTTTVAKIEQEQQRHQCQPFIGRVLGDSAAQVSNKEC